MVGFSKTGAACIRMSMYLSFLLYVRWYQLLWTENHHSDSKEYAIMIRELLNPIFQYSYVCLMGQCSWQEEMLQARHFKEIWKNVSLDSHYERFL